MMRIVCKYNREYEKFLKKVVERIFVQYGNEIQREAIKVIELKDKKEFPIQSDGRFIKEGYILLSSRLYDELVCLDLKHIEHTKEYNLIVNTLIHEMGHASDMCKMPKLYHIGLHSNDIEERTLVIFWTEYLAQRRNTTINIVDRKEFCKEFSLMKWDICKENIKDSDSGNFYYLTKIIPYFLARTLDLVERQVYLDNIKNCLVKDYLIELGKEIKCLELQSVFDEIDDLSGINIIIKKYRKLFLVDTNNI